MTQYERDEVGLLKDHRCPHCNALLYLSPEDEAKGRGPICLNACHLPVWQYRIMQDGLRAAHERVREQMEREAEAGHE